MYDDAHYQFSNRHAALRRTLAAAALTLGAVAGLQGAPVHALTPTPTVRPIEISCELNIDPLEPMVGDSVVVSVLRTSTGLGYPGFELTAESLFSAPLHLGGGRFELEATAPGTTMLLGSTTDEFVVGYNDGLPIYSFRSAGCGATVRVRAAGERPPCEACKGDFDGDGSVTVNELVQAVAAALDGCSPAETRTPTPTPSPTATCAPTGTPACVFDPEELDDPRCQCPTVRPNCLAQACGGCRVCTPPPVDLVPQSFAPLPCPGGCGPLRVEICVANQGGSATGSFDVQLNGETVSEIDGLPAFGSSCIETNYRFASPSGESASVAVDTAQRIAEANETNNVQSFPAPNPTACDVICTTTPGPGS